MNDRNLLQRFCAAFDDLVEVKDEYKHLFPLRYPNWGKPMKYAEYQELIEKVKAADTIKALTDLAAENGLIYCSDLTSGEVIGIYLKSTAEYIPIHNLPKDIPGKIWNPLPELEALFDKYRKSKRTAGE